ncbi:hypothetical protein [Pectobacterium carotovorum]|uniref:hypothetical protein n=1 Tax=Pectobacterium carotovorum TaxID=554 RepID=UPI001F366155|nr:hypothetical protein [Pectobacterium carotovorum]
MLIDRGWKLSLAFEVIDFFRLSREDANRIHAEVLSAVKGWQTVANQLGINRSEQLAKQEAFNV